ncbi:MAG: acyltransferase [Deltaproteobacteria bacterium]|nr:acyltransferase [Deltaproteobacteria bacterium]
MAIQSVADGSKEYYQFFDPIRITAMLCVVLYHSVIAYSRVTPQFPIHDSDPIAFCDYVRWIFDVFMMPIFFFMAGFFSIASLKSKSLTSFYTGKLKRIGLPWLAVMICLIAPSFIFAQKLRPAFINREIISLGDVIINMFKGFALPWDPSYQSNQGHLWYLSLLLFFFIVLGIIHKTREKLVGPVTIKDRSQVSLEKSVVIPLIVFGLLMSIVYFVMLLLIPKIDDFVFWGFLVFEPTKLVFYAGYFALGAYIYSRNRFIREQNIGHIGFWTAILVDRVIPNGFPLTSLVLFSVARSMFCLSVFIVLIILAKRFWHSTSTFAGKLSQNSYHIYIIHFFIVLALSAALIKWQGGPTWLKLAIVFFTALIISYLISQYITNRFPKITLAGLLLICCLLAFSLNPHRYERKFDQKQLEFKEKLSLVSTDPAALRIDSITSFKNALDDPEKYAPEAFEKLSMSLHSQPDDYEVMSYLGRVTVMLLPPDTSGNTFDSLVHIVKGYQWVDLAVAKDPDNIKIRLNRAHDSLKQVPFLEREKYAIVDFEYLVRRIKEDSSIDTSIKKEVFSNLIILYEKNGRHEESERLKRNLLELKY